ncbi:MAG: hypothetical protein ACI865_000487 [Flavobacteriaceae bacterium]|jgi:hypothetical protein
MLKLVQKHKVSLILVLVGGLIGAVMYINEPTYAAWQITYEFDLESIDELPDFCATDTLFVYDEILVRSYSSAFGDTLRDEQIARQALKTYLEPGLTREQARSFVEALFFGFDVDILRVSFSENQKNKRIILDMILLGLFLGMVVDFFLGMKKKPNPQE